MKKHLLALSSLILFSLFISQNINAAKVYSFEESFASPVAQYWGYTSAGGGSINYDATNKLLQMRWSLTGSATKSLGASITPSTIDNKVTLEMIVKYYTSGSSSNPGCLYFLDNTGNPVFGLVFWRSSSQWRLGRATSYIGPGNPTVNPTVADYLAVDQPTAKITAVFDFGNHTVDYSAVQGTFDYATRVFTAAGATVSSTAQPFLSTAATDIQTLYSNYRRATTTSGTNGYDLMYMGISKEENVPTASVTVKFKDQDNNYFKPDEEMTGEIVGSTYDASSAQKASVTLNDSYYVLDPTSPTSVSVDAAGSTLTLLFRKSVLNSDLVWNGSSIDNGDLWSDWYENFLNSSNAVSAYQTNANSLFDIHAVNKSVMLNQTINMGAGNIMIASDGYTFNGTGAINGSGILNVNPGLGATTVLNVTNNQTGGVNILSGALEVGKAVSGAFFSMKNGTQLNLNPDGDFSKAINGEGEITVRTIANRSYGGSITGASTVNLILGITGAVVNGTNWSSKVTTTMPAGAKVNVTTTQSSAGYAVSSNSLQNSKVDLGAGVRLFHNYNAATGGTTIFIAELTGDAASTVEGGWQNFSDRNLNYEIGSGNSDATFNGKFLNYGTSLSAPLNIYKKGTGIWTLTGTSDAWVNGNFRVDAGKVVMNGAISSTAVPATVAAGATLSGTGTIGGITTVNGILEGRMNFGADLNLLGTTNIMVNGFNSGEFDVINVVGATNNGGVLNISITVDPTTDGSIQLIKSGSYAGTFSAVNIVSPSNPAAVPAGAPRRASAATSYSYDPATGILTYAAIPTGVSDLNISAGIYPTITRNQVFVDGENVNFIEVISVAGQKVKRISANGKITILKLNDMSDGVYLVKVIFNNGTSKTQRIILQK